MKKVLLGVLTVLLIITLTSCSLFSSITDIFKKDTVTAEIEINGVKMSQYDYTVDYLLEGKGVNPNSTFSINVDSSGFYDFLSSSGIPSDDARVIVKYDSSVLEYAGQYYVGYAEELIASRGLELAENEKMYATPDEWLDFKVRGNAAPGETTITFEYVRNGYAAEYTEVLSIRIIINDLSSAVEMASDESTRFYMEDQDYVLHNSLYDVDLRGIVAGTTQDTDINFDSIFTSYHDVEASVQVVNYDGTVNAYLDNSTYDASKVLSTTGTSLNLYIYAGYDMNETEDYLNAEDVQIRFYLDDKTDGILYYKDIYYPIEDFSSSMCEISGFSAATNGNSSLGAIAGTEVWLDAYISAFSTEDTFRNFRIIVEDSTGERVYNSSRYMYGDSASGTISTGWDASGEIFGERYFAFTPKNAGTYYAALTGYDDGGYNATALVTSFEVTN